MFLIPIPRSFLRDAPPEVRRILFVALIAGGALAVGLFLSNLPR